MSDRQGAPDLARDLLLAVRDGDTSAASTIAGALATMTESALGGDLETDEARIATWIDLYNAATQRLVGADPTASARGARFFRRPALTVAGRTLSLDALEHGLLRGSRPKVGLGYLGNPFAGRFERRFRVRRPDPRAHFALNCAAASCPPIAAYDSRHLDRQLDLATRAYLSANVRRDGETLIVPRIFRWFPGDFRGSGGVRGFLAAHGVPADGSLRYAPWDWTPAPGAWLDPGDGAPVAHPRASGVWAGPRPDLSEPAIMGAVHPAPEHSSMTSDPLMHPGSVVVHGVASCEDTTRARARFDAAGLPYRYVDLDRDVETRAALHARGLMATPVVVMPDGGVLVEPTDPELDGVIERHRGGART